MYSKYPIGKLIIEAMENANIKRAELIKEIGYMNINKGLRHLDACLRGKKLSGKFLINLARVLKIDNQTLNEAVKNTLEEIRYKQEKRERLHFKPHIYIKHSESRPRSITTICFVGLSFFKHIELPSNIHTVSDEEQIKIVQTAIRQHEDRGMFGEVTGHLYRKTYDYSIEFSVAGEMIGHSTEKINEPKATLTIGNKTIEGGILGLRSLNNNQGQKNRS